MGFRCSPFCLVAAAQPGITRVVVKHGSTFIALATSRGLQGLGWCGVMLEGAAVAVMEGREGRGHAISSRRGLFVTPPRSAATLLFVKLKPVEI